MALSLILVGLLIRLSFPYPAVACSSKGFLLGTNFCMSHVMHEVIECTLGPVYHALSAYKDEDLVSLMNRADVGFL